MVKPIRPIDRQAHYPQHFVNGAGIPIPPEVRQRVAIYVRWHDFRFEPIVVEIAVRVADAAIRRMCMT